MRLAVHDQRSSSCASQRRISILARTTYAQRTVHEISRRPRAEGPILPNVASRNWRVLPTQLYSGSETFARNDKQRNFPWRDVFVTPKPIAIQGTDVSPDREWLDLHSGRGHRNRTSAG